LEKTREQGDRWFAKRDLAGGQIPVCGAKKRKRKTISNGVGKDIVTAWTVQVSHGEGKTRHFEKKKRVKEKGQAQKSNPVPEESGPTRVRGEETAPKKITEPRGLRTKRHGINKAKRVRKKGVDETSMVKRGTQIEQLAGKENMAIQTSEKRSIFKNRSNVLRKAWRLKKDRKKKKESGL